MNTKKYDLNEIEYIKNIIKEYILENINLNELEYCFKNNINFKSEIVSNISVEKIKYLYNNYNLITTKKGLYFVITTNNIDSNNITDDIKLKNNKIYKGKLYPKEVLIKKYENIRNNKYSNILYIGKAQCKNGLRERISKYINFGYGKCKNHSGGRAIWQLKNNDEFYIAWLQSDNLKDNFINKIESNLINNYNSYNTNKSTMNYPFANWRK